VFEDPVKTIFEKYVAARNMFNLVARTIGHVSWGGYNGIRTSSRNTGSNDKNYQD